MIIADNCLRATLQLSKQTLKEPELLVTGALPAQTQKGLSSSYKPPTVEGAVHSEKESLRPSQRYSIQLGSEPKELVLVFNLQSRAWREALPPIC